MNDTLIKLLRVYITGEAKPDIIDVWDKRIALQPNVDDYGEYLRQEYRDGKLDSIGYNCIDRYEKGVKQWPNDAIMYFNLAFAYLVFCDELEKDYLKSRSERLKAEPDFVINENAEMNGKIATFKDYFIMRITIGRYLNKIIELEPDLPADIAAYIQKNISELQQPKCWETEISPRGAGIHFGLGQNYEEDGKPEEAIKEYLKAVCIDPDHSTVQELLGNLYKSRGMFDEAAAHYQEIVRAFPEFPAGYYLLGSLYHSCGKLDEAVLEYEKIIKIAPEQTTPYLNLAVIYNKQNKPDKAEKEYQEALKLVTNAAEIHIELAWIYKELHDVENAIREYNEALAIDPNNYLYVYNALGMIYIQQRKFDKAIDEFQIVIEKEDTRNIEAHYGMALALEETGALEKSLIHWRIYVQMAGDDPIYANWQDQAAQHIKTIESKLKGNEAENTEE